MLNSHLLPAMPSAPEDYYLQNTTLYPRMVSLIGGISTSQVSNRRLKIISHQELKMKSLRKGSRELLYFNKFLQMESASQHSHQPLRKGGDRHEREMKKKS